MSRRARIIEGLIVIAIAIAGVWMIGPVATLCVGLVGITIFVLAGWIESRAQRRRLQKMRRQADEKRVRA